MEKHKTRYSFSLKEQGHILKTMFKYALPYWKQFAIAILATIIAAIITAYLPTVIRHYLDNMVGMKDPQYEMTLRVALTYLGLILFKTVLYYIQNYTFYMASERTVANMRNKLYHKVVNLGMRYFDQTPSGSVVSRVTNDTENVKEFWSIFLTFFEGVFNVISITFAMFVMNQRLAMIALSFLPFMVLLVWIYQRYSTIVYRRMQGALSRVNAKLAESISGMSIIQIFNQEERMSQEFDNVNQDYVKARKNMFKMNALLLMPAINLGETIALVLIIWIAGRQYLGGRALDIGVVYAFTSYVKSFFSPMGNIMDSLSIYQSGLVSGWRIENIMKRTDDAPQALPKASGEITEGRIEIKNLSFSYDGKHEILHDINLSAPAGSTIAFVGQTGSGKSSIINVLMRFYDYQKGQILIDDQDLREIPIGELRNNMGLVLQDSFMFYGDIKGNIRLHGAYDLQQVKTAAEFVNADSFIKHLPADYDTHVIEGGKAFSIGQKQLLSFARTIIREPKILILDEATSNIDTETELIIQDGLKKMRKDRTTIMIAHRLSTIRDADCIYVLSNGRIVEAGNHESLIKAKGRYYEMYRLQTYQGQHIA